MSVDGRRPRELLRVLYLSHAPEAVYGMVRAAAGDRAEVITLERDCDDERRAKLPDAEVVVVAAYPFRADLIAAALRLRLVQHQGVGYHDTVDLDALSHTGARLALTPAGTTVGVAEHAVLLALAVYRRLAFLDAELRQGRWHVNTLRSEARELAGKTVGYVGMGRIGQAAAARFWAFETRGVYADPAGALAPDRERALGLRRVAMDELLAVADVVSLHLPLTAATRRIIDAEALARMKEGAILVNTARGPLVDEGALAAALESGHLGGAGLDVFEVEPPAAANPLFARRDVVVTPHVSVATRDAFEQKMDSVFANVARFLKGEPLTDEVVLPPPQRNGGAGTRPTVAAL